MLARSELRLFVLDIGVQNQFFIYHDNEVEPGMGKYEGQKLQTASTWPSHCVLVSWWGTHVDSLDTKSSAHRGSSTVGCDKPKLLQTEIWSVADRPQQADAGANHQAQMSLTEGKFRHRGLRSESERTNNVLCAQRQCPRKMH